MFAKVFRWFINLFFLAIPWSFISQILLGYNLFFNIKWNFLWAGGNVWLLFNTIYLIEQTIHSVFLTVEMPFWMKFNKVGRWISLILASIYNTLFLIMFCDFIALLFFYDKSEYGIGYLFESMFFAYNIIIHFPITFVNSMIISKEFSMEFIQMT